MMSQADILTALQQAVIKFREKECQDIARQALDLGMDPLLVLEQGLLPGIKEVGLLYDINEYFVPEVMFSTDALYAALEILRPHIFKKNLPSKRSMVIGSIMGDVHDIGKNLVKIMFDTAGWEVHDLGKDVPFERFVEKHLEVKSDIIAISAMMTTTTMGMKKVIAMAKEKDPDCLVMLGGASVTREIADLFGADGYAKSYTHAVDEGLRIIRQKTIFKERNIQEKEISINPHASLQTPISALIIVSATQKYTYKIM